MKQGVKFPPQANTNALRAQYSESVKFAKISAKMALDGACVVYIAGIQPRFAVWNALSWRLYNFTGGTRVRLMLEVPCDSPAPQRVSYFAQAQLLANIAEIW